MIYLICTMYVLHNHSTITKPCYAQCAFSTQTNQFTLSSWLLALLRKCFPLMVMHTSKTKCLRTYTVYNISSLFFVTRNHKTESLCTNFFSSRCCITCHKKKIQVYLRGIKDVDASWAYPQLRYKWISFITKHKSKCISCITKHKTERWKYDSKMLEEMSEHNTPYSEKTGTP